MNGDDAAAALEAAVRTGESERVRDVLARFPALCVRLDDAMPRDAFGDGQTPLHVGSSAEIATFLLDNGADIDVLDIDHESTPAKYLVPEHQDVVRHLISRGCKTDILMAAAVGDMALVRHQLHNDPLSIWTTVSPQHFPMIDSRAVQLMLSSGWPANAMTQSGLTALHWAAFHGNAALVRDLLRHGASVLARDSTFGGILAGWAEHGAQNSWNRESGGYPAVLRVLAAAGAGR